MPKKPARARICPHCGVLVDPTDTRCFQCGTSMAPIAAPGLRLWLKRNVRLQGNMTWIILCVNLAMFLAEWILGRGEGGIFSGLPVAVLNRLGAKNPQLILEGEYWRLVTAMFVHASLLHIFFNMWVFVDLGKFIENLYGWQRFLFFYLFSGIVGFMASTVFYPQVLGVGASGAILGIAGSLLAYSARSWKTHGRELGKGIMRWFLYILIIGFVLSGYIDNSAHIGGFVSGFLIALPFPPHPPRNSRQLWVDGVLGLLSILIIAASFTAMIAS